MENEAHFFWKNFRLGTELQTAGSFLYNAFYCLENMESFYWEHEIFEFLYNVSVGIERLEKISVVLLEHNETTNQEEFERSLITHSHQDLIKRIKKKSKGFAVSKQGNLLLELLQEFYNSARYDRYNLSSVYRPAMEQAGLIKFVSNELKITISNEAPFATSLDDKIKKFLGKVIGKLAVSLYKLIKSEARKLNIYTYEMTSDSKSFKIFMAEEFDFISERRMQREVFLYLYKQLSDGGVKNLINDTDPIEFGQLSNQQYLQTMFSYHGDRQVLDELDTIEEENRSSKQRIEVVNILGSGVDLDFAEDFE